MRHPHYHWISRSSETVAIRHRYDQQSSQLGGSQCIPSFPVLYSRSAFIIAIRDVRVKYPSVHSLNSLTPSFITTLIMLTSTPLYSQAKSEMASTHKPHARRSMIFMCQRHWARCRDRPGIQLTDFVDGFSGFNRDRGQREIHAAEIRDNPRPRRDRNRTQWQHQSRCDEQFASFGNVKNCRNECHY